jgi:hypothetical protein
MRDLPTPYVDEAGRPADRPSRIPVGAIVTSDDGRQWQYDGAKDDGPGWRERPIEHAEANDLPVHAPGQLLDWVDVGGAMGIPEGVQVAIIDHAQPSMGRTPSKAVSIVFRRYVPPPMVTRHTSGMDIGVVRRTPAENAEALIARIHDAVDPWVADQAPDDDLPPLRRVPPQDHLDVAPPDFGTGAKYDGPVTPRPYHPDLPDLDAIDEPGKGDLPPQHGPPSGLGRLVAFPPGTPGYPRGGWDVVGPQPSTAAQAPHDGEPTP